MQAAAPAWRPAAGAAPQIVGPACGSCNSSPWDAVVGGTAAPLPRSQSSRHAKGKERKMQRVANSSKTLFSGAIFVSPAPRAPSAGARSHAVCRTHARTRHAGALSGAPVAKVAPVEPRNAAKLFSRRRRTLRPRPLPAATPPPERTPSATHTCAPPPWTTRTARPTTLAACASGRTTSTTRSPTWHPSSPPSSTTPASPWTEATTSRPRPPQPRRPRRPRRPRARPRAPSWPSPAAWRCRRRRPPGRRRWGQMMVSVCVV